MSSTSYPGAAPLSSIIPFPSRAIGGSQWEKSLHTFETAVAVMERAMDFCAVAAAVWLACWWLRLTGGTQVTQEKVLLAAACFGVLMVLLLEKYGDYRPCMSLLAVRETERLLRVTTLAVLLAFPIAVTHLMPRRLLALAIGFALATLSLEKWLLRKIIRVVRRQHGLTRNAVIVGTGIVGRRIFSALSRSPRLGIDPVAFVESCGPIEEPVIYESGCQRKREARVLAGPVTAKLLRRAEASVLILADPAMEPEEAKSVGREAAAAGIRTYVIPDAFTDETSETEYVDLDGLMLAHRPKHEHRLTFEAVKRLLDVVASGITLLLLSPVFAAAALAVKFSSPGPVIFRQRRVGHEGRPFEMYKFRTMHVESPRYAASPITGSDPRITRVGRILRHTCIDELPQLVNVLRGEMSLVGPRPEMPFIVEQYEPEHRKRLTVKPGITGLWQLSADRMSPIHENISYDLYYLRHRNVLMDVAILLHTVVFAFRGV